MNNSFQGNHQIVEIAYQRTKRFDKLLFLYFLTGNSEKLTKMLKIAELRKDYCGWFEVALYLGEVSERLKILVGCGQFALAYVTAVTYGLQEEAVALATNIESSGGQLPAIDPNTILLMPRPSIRQLTENWPRLVTSKSLFECQFPKVGTGAVSALPVAAEGEVEEGWGEDTEFAVDDEFKEAAEELTVNGKAEMEVGEEAGWEVEGDIELPPDLLESAGSGTLKGGGGGALYVPPSMGQPPTYRWTNQSRLPVEFVLAASFDSAFRLLNQQIAVVNFEPFKPLFMLTLARSRAAFSSFSCTNTLFCYPLRTSKDASSKVFPVVGFKLNDLASHLQASLLCYQLTTSGKFMESLTKFHRLLLSVPMLLVDTKQEIAEAQELIRICREYLVGIKMEMKRKEMPKETKDDLVRSAEMAAYFTHCDLQPVHKILTLRTAINLLFKMKNYKTCASMCYRVLELGPKPEIAHHVRKLLVACEKDPRDEQPLNYDEHNPFSICAETYKPIYRGKACTVCPFCKASYIPQMQGKLCNVCEVSEIGKDCTGLKVCPLQFK
ncbi:unnamed protein product [Soboliphyme baturini]|uniref:Coatomer alpha subunit C-terminal domain-containing protein n=1 Tax=Soboliphyme baturini TaxID=241478 RepID=A0A3P8AZV4_9BILA|nr:unnamed protein product [Soboliphyme baturini]